MKALIVVVAESLLLFTVRSMGYGRISGYQLDVLLPQCDLSNIGASLLPHIGHNILCTIPFFESLSRDRDA